jgi:hypothetical protein
VLTPGATATADAHRRRSAITHVLSGEEEHGQKTVDVSAPPPLKAGDHVQHDMFGEGVVVNCLASGGDHQVTIAFKGEAGVKRFLLSLAPLQKLS